MDLFTNNKEKQQNNKASVFLSANNTQKPQKQHTETTHRNTAAMDPLELDEAAAFTPLKASFKIHEEVDQGDDAILKIPHGLTAKKNRRKSYHNENAVDSFALTPMRVPLTAPRKNVLNSQPIKGFEHTKRSLIDELRSMRPGKENEQSSPVKLDITVTPSSPETAQKKRLSSAIDLPDVEGTSHKLAKPNDQIVTKDDDDFILVENSTLRLDEDQVQSQHQDHEQEQVAESLPIDDLSSETGDEELSRIEPFAKESSLVPTQDDSIHLNLNQDIYKELATPSRITEPVAMSPKTEQNSRVVDESHLLLDTSKSPNFDDSFVTESPISHNNSISFDKHDHLNVLESLEEILEDEILPSHRRSDSVAPKERPFFTIKQVHEIQAEFKSEVEKLQESLKSKSLRVLEMNEQVNENQSKIYQLQDTIDSLNLTRKQLSKDNDLLAAEQGIFKSDIKELQTAVDAKNGLVSRQKHVIQKFKERVSELTTENQSKTQLVEELQSEVETKVRAIEVLKNRSIEFEEQCKSLFAKLNEETQRSEKLSTNEAETLQAFEELKSELESNRSKIEELSTQIVDLELLSATKSSSIEELESELQARDCALSQVDSEKLSLQQQIEALSERNLELENRLASEGETSNTKFEELETRLSLVSKEQNLKNAMISGLQSGILSLQNTIGKLRTQVTTQRRNIQEMSSSFNEVNELLVIRKAEVDELNFEVEQSQKEISSLHSLVQDKNHDIEQLSNVNEDHSKTIQLKNDKIHELDEELQKQEAEHLIELETFHTEMSNLQNMVTARSTELHKLKEEKELLVKENDLLRYEVDTVKGESIDFDTRLTTMKAKLQESRSYINSLEEHINELKADKLSLEAETDKRLQELAEDLYIQYSKKHEQKVQVLKRGYEQKWSNKYTKLENEQEKLKREIEGLKSQLENERKDKNEIIKLWDQQREEAAQE